MAAKRKPQLSSSQPVTLHRFFSGPGQARNLGAKPKLSQEVIIIDSDDELESGVDGELDSAYQRASDAPSKRRRIGSSRNINAVDDRTVGPLPDILLFGKPSTLLLPPREEHLPVSSNSRRHLTNGQPFSTSTTPDDDWNMGDDEQPITDCEPIGELGASLPSTTPAIDGCQLTSCPMCEVAFENLSLADMEDHINRCLDATTTTSSDLKPPNSTNSVTPRLCSSGGSSRTNGNAFSLLMSSIKESEAWKEASIVEDRNFRLTKENDGRRKAPFYKVMQGMPIAVDAFRYGAIPGVTAYFLTHAHSDHYTNLAANWKNGPIYCSHDTAKLIIHFLSVDPKWVHPLPFDKPSVIPNTGGVQVTLIQANHCPGSCLFLFEGLQTIHAGDSSFKSPFVDSPRIFRYLHCGDFRASPQHVLHPAVKGKRIDTVYLDTTYLDPKYTFPPQPLVISACAELAKRIVAGADFDGSADGTPPQTVDAWMTRVNPAKDDTKISDRVLVVIGTYSIGKERIVKAVAHALQTKVYCDSRKTEILHCQDDPDLHALLTTDPHSAGVHIVPLSVIASDKLKAYSERYKGTFKRVVGFRPTGWTYTPPAGTDMSPPIATIISRSQQRTFAYTHLRPSRNSTTSLQVFGVPYSEHSSFFELTCFALSFNWGKMIATVNVGSESSRGKMSKWIEKWEAERKKRGQDTVVQYRAPDYW